MRRAAGVRGCVVGGWFVDSREGRQWGNFGGRRRLPVFGGEFARGRLLCGVSVRRQQAGTLGELTTQIRWFCGARATRLCGGERRRRVVVVTVSGQLF